MNAVKRRVVAAILSLAGMPALAQPAAECRAGEGGVSNVNVVVVAIDRTAARSATFNAGVVAAISAAIRPNTRVVLWTFGGRAQPLPQLLVDVVTPALPSNDVVDINVLAARMMNTSGHEDCVKDWVLARVEERRRAFLAALRAELEIFDPSPQGSSPILLTLGQAVEAVSVEAAQGLVDVVAVTDGFEHSAEASFYPTAAGRYLTPEEALARTRRVAGNLRGARVSMASIGVVVDAAVDTAAVSTLIELWRAILVARGAIPVQLTTGPPQRLRR